MKAPSLMPMKMVKAWATLQAVVSMTEWLQTLLNGSMNAFRRVENLMDE